MMRWNDSAIPNRLITHARYVNHVKFGASASLPPVGRARCTACFSGAQPFIITIYRTSEASSLTLSRHYIAMFCHD